MCDVWWFLNLVSSARLFIDFSAAFCYSWISDVRDDVVSRAVSWANFFRSIFIFFSSTVLRHVTKQSIKSNNNNRNEWKINKLKQQNYLKNWTAAVENWEYVVNMTFVHRMNTITARSKSKPLLFSIYICLKTHTFSPRKHNYIRVRLNCACIGARLCFFERFDVLVQFDGVTTPIAPILRNVLL